MAGRPLARLRTRRTLVTLGGAVVAALVLWQIRPSAPTPVPRPVDEPLPEPDRPLGPDPESPNRLR